MAEPECPADWPKGRTFAQNCHAWVCGACGCWPCGCYYGRFGAPEAVHRPDAAPDDA